MIGYRKPYPTPDDKDPHEILLLVLDAFLLTGVGFLLLRSVHQHLSIGTRTILYGAHQFLLHPVFVAWAWWRLFGFPRDYRLWVCFVVHDWGYWGKPNLDGPEGERHVEWAAALVSRLFDDPQKPYRVERRMYSRRDRPKYLHDLRRGWKVEDLEGDHILLYRRRNRWEDFCLFHSRFYAKEHGLPVSRLCLADKLANVLVPLYLYLFLVNLTGEVHEYMSQAREGKYTTMNVYHLDQVAWWQGVRVFIRAWVRDHLKEVG